MKERDLGLEEILAAAREPDEESGARHSPLYEWFWARHAKLAPELNPPRTPNWRKMAVKFDGLGFKNGKGGVLNAITVRQTWAKVERDKEIAAQRLTPQTGQKRPAQPAAQSPLPLPAQEVSLHRQGLGLSPEEGGSDGQPPRTKRFNLATRK